MTGCGTNPNMTIPFTALPKAVLPIILLTALLSGCGWVRDGDSQAGSGSALLVTRPNPLSEAELASQATLDRQAAQENVPPLGSTLSLEEAIARALKFNLSRRERVLQEALSLRQLDATRFEMLPSVLARTGYLSRDNDNTRLSRNQEGELAPNQFVSQDRTHELSEFGLSWSLLDLGMGYYSSVQDTDRLLIAVERRRKTTHLLMQDVRAAFWQAAVAQRVESMVAQATHIAEAALVDSRKAEQARVGDPVDALRYQRQLLENLRLLESLAQELSTARVELFRLINVPLSSDVVLVEPAGIGVDSALLRTPPEKLEELALARNPDLRIRSYDARIARVEARKTLVKLFPDLGFNYNINYDTDNYLVNNRWNQASLQLSFNLMNLLAFSSQKKLAEAGVALADQRRVTAQAAVLAQVHLARLELVHAERLLARAKEISATDKRLFKIIRSQSQAELASKLEETSNATSSILSLMRFYQAKADAQAAEARLRATLGDEPSFELDGAETADLATLSELLRKSLDTRAQAPAPASEPARLIGIRAGRVGERVQYVVDLSRNVRPVSFEIAAPRRLVLEFPGTSLGQSFVSDGAWPPGIPAPRHHDDPTLKRVRLVLDVPPDMTAGTLLVPPSRDHGHRLVITLEGSGKAPVERSSPGITGDGNLAATQSLNNVPTAPTQVGI